MTTPAELVERARQRWNAGNLPGYLQLYAEDLRFHGVGPDPMDKPSVTGFYQQFERPNVHLVAPTFSSPELIQGAEACVVIGSTVGIEALLRFTLTGGGS